jgi:hypothetical protein
LQLFLVVIQALLVHSSGPQRAICPRLNQAIVLAFFRRVKFHAALRTWAFL